MICLVLQPPPTSGHGKIAVVSPLSDQHATVSEKCFRDLGISEAKTAQAIHSISSRQEQQEKQLSLHQAQIRSLQMALQGIVTQYELDKLVGLSAAQPFLCYYSEDLYKELKQLRAMGLVHHHDGVGLSTIRRSYKDRNEQFDLKRFFYITEQGREYLNLRRELIREDD